MGVALLALLILVGLLLLLCGPPPQPRTVSLRSSGAQMLPRLLEA